MRPAGPSVATVGPRGEFPLRSRSYRARFEYKIVQIREWVRAARLSRGWSLAEFAHALGRSKAACVHWEVGRREPTWAQIQAIATATGFPLPSDDSVRATVRSEPDAPQSVLSDAQWLMLRESLEDIGPEQAAVIASALRTYAEVVREVQSLTSTAATLRAKVRALTGKSEP